MNLTQKRKMKIKELWNRLVDEAKHDGRGELTILQWSRILGKFKIETGMSEGTINDYISTLRDMGAITNNWWYAGRQTQSGNPHIPYHKLWEHYFRYIINLGFKLPYEKEEGI